MTFTKSILLGSATALLAVASANAADLPSRKSAPVEYVKVCTAYGAGFFFIPGTDTCLKIGGRVRADYAYVGAKAQFSALGTVAGTTAPVVSQAKDGQNTIGYEARGRIDFDARTQTAFGTVQAAAGLRMARVTGILSQAAAASATSTGTTLEYAYVRFAGFTFGASRDNFAFMPSLTYGAGHWASFANGAKQLAYTATFGGGISATIALQDYTDTGAGFGNNSGVTPYYVYNSIPQVNANVRIDQSWGALQLMGAYADVSVNTATDTYDKSKGVYAIGAGAKINLPMLAKGDALYLTAAYANGMTEYTTNWTSFKSSAYSRDVNGYTMNHPSLVAETTGLETVKSWAVAALFEHYWAPQYRSVLFGSYGQLDAPAAAKTRVWNGTTGFGDATTWNVGTNFAWLPTKGFEIGVEVIYARVNQDVRGYTAASTALGPVTAVSSKSDSNVTGRLRVERTF
jgi:hypothetical protein